VVWRCPLLRRFAGQKVALLSLFVLGCHHEAEPEPSPPEVRVEVAALRPSQTRQRVVGVLAAPPGGSVRVASLTAGRVVRLLVAEGEAVKVGQPLALVDAQPLKQRVVETEARQQQATEAVTFAKQRLERAERAVEAGVGSKQELDDARAALVAARAAAVEAGAASGVAGYELGRATIRSPLSGVVAALLAAPGQVVDAAGQTPLVDVIDPHILELRALVPPGRLPRAGDPAEVDTESGPPLPAIVAAVAPVVDASSGAVLVRVRVDNPAGLLRPGALAHGTLLGAPAQRLTVPEAALLPGDGGTPSTLALLDKNDTVELRTVTLGGSDGTRIEVTSGLAPGDRVILAGAYSLPAGAKVHVVTDK
jgi:RND family efflux transporter MFP subunit